VANKSMAKHVDQCHTQEFLNPTDKAGKNIPA